MSKFEKFANLASVSESVGARRNEAPTASRGPVSVPADQVGRARAKNAWTIEVDRIVPDPDQPRKEFDEDALARLAESLKTRGQLQPIQVRWEPTMERFVVLMGERRYRAALAAGLPNLQCIVRDEPIDDAQRLGLQLIENCLREDLAPVEQARAFRALMDSQGWNQERLAEELSVSPMLVSRSLGLLRLPAEVQEKVDAGTLAASAANEIAKLDDPAAQIRLATAAAEQGLTRDDVAKQVRKTPSKKKAPAAKKLPAARVWRIDGCRVEVARKAGVDPVTALAALKAAAELLAAELAEATAEAA